MLPSINAYLLHLNSFPLIFATFSQLVCCRRKKACQFFNFISDSQSFILINFKQLLYHRTINIFYLFLSFKQQPKIFILLHNIYVQEIVNKLRFYAAKFKCYIQFHSPFCLLLVLN